MVCWQVDPEMEQLGFGISGSVKLEDIRLILKKYVVLSGVLMDPTLLLEETTINYLFFLPNKKAR